VLPDFITVIVFIMYEMEGEGKEEGRRLGI
jgi:hypothetical protein